MKFTSRLHPFMLALGAASCVSAAAAEYPPAAVAPADWSSIRAAHEAWRHAFQPTDTGWQAINPGQRWTTRFDARGFIAEPRDGGWQWGLELRSYGFGEAQRAIDDAPAVRAEGQRLAYQWDALVQEWWVNDRRGLEHGFIVAQRPPAAAEASASSASTTAAATPLSFLLGVRGTLAPSVSADALSVLFKDAAGATILSYSGLKVWDADGKILASRFEPAGADAVRLLVDERGARYPLTIDPIAQQAYVKASNAIAAERFGTAVAAAGNTVVVGALEEGTADGGVNVNPNPSFAPKAGKNYGAAYVFVRNGAAWTQQAFLKASNPGDGDLFGASVALSGDTLVVGALSESSISPDSGAAYVFVRNGTAWTQQAMLKASNVRYTDGLATYSGQFGLAVAIAGDTLVVGAPAESSKATGVDGNQLNLEALGSGAAYVFARSGATWTQQAYLKASNTSPGSRFGYAVGISGDTVIVGAPNESNDAAGIGPGTAEDNRRAPDSGAAYVYVRRNPSAWSLQAYLKASNTGVNDEFGRAVAIAGETVLVGAPGEASSATGVGGSQQNNSALGAGAVYAFVRSGATWSQQAYLKASNTGSGDAFGQAVSLAGDTALIGAPQEDSDATGVDGSQGNDAALGSGAVYVFRRSAATWSQQAYLKASNTTAGHEFGFSAAIAGDIIAVGAWKEGSAAVGIGGNQFNFQAPQSGAAYLFADDAPPAAPSRLINLSVLTSLDAPGDEFTLGYVVGGTGTAGTKALVIRAAGPSLGALGVPGTLPDPTMEFFAGTNSIGTNDNWGGGPDLVAAMARVGAFAFIGPASRDAAVQANIRTRDNSVRVTGVGGVTGAVIAEVYDATPAVSFMAATPRLLNLSVRKHLGTGLTAGFVVGGGTAAVRVLVRVAGPGLAQFGVPGTVVDPQLALFNAQSQQIAANNDWASAADVTAAGNSVGAFPLPANSRDAALVATLAPGNYSVRATGVNGTTGVALVEVYELP